MSDLFSRGSQNFLCILPLYGCECFIFEYIYTECSFKVWYKCKVEFYTPNKDKFQMNMCPEKPPIQVTALISFPTRHHTFVSSPPRSELKFHIKCSKSPFGSCRCRKCRQRCYVFLLLPFARQEKRRRMSVIFRNKH